MNQEFNRWLTKEQIESNLKEISDMWHKNITKFEVDNNKDITIFYKDTLNVHIIRDIEFMWYSITNIDSKKVKFSKRYDTPKF